MKVGSFFLAPTSLSYVLCFKIARQLRIEELYVELSRFNLPVIPFCVPTEELRNIVFNATLSELILI